MLPCCPLVPPPLRVVAPVVRHWLPRSTTKRITPTASGTALLRVRRVGPTGSGALACSRGPSARPRPPPSRPLCFFRAVFPLMTSSMAGRGQRAWCAVDRGRPARRCCAAGRCALKMHLKRVDELGESTWRVNGSHWGMLVQRIDSSLAGSASSGVWPVRCCRCHAHAIVVRVYKMYTVDYAPVPCASTYARARSLTCSAVASSPCCRSKVR